MIEVTARVLIWLVSIMVAVFVVRTLRHQHNQFLKQLWLPTVSSVIVVALLLFMLAAVLGLPHATGAVSGGKWLGVLAAVVVALGGYWWGTAWLQRHVNVFASAVSAGLLAGGCALLILFVTA